MWFRASVSVACVSHICSLSSASFKLWTLGHFLFFFLWWHYLAVMLDGVGWSFCFPVSGQSYSIWLIVKMSCVGFPPKDRWQIKVPQWGVWPQLQCFFVRILNNTGGTDTIHDGGGGGGEGCLTCQSKIFQGVEFGRDLVTLKAIAYSIHITVISSNPSVTSHDPCRSICHVSPLILFSLFLQFVTHLYHQL